MFQINNLEHNHLSTLNIVSQMQVNSLAQQILTTFWLETDKENFLFELKVIYN